MKPMLLAFAAIAVIALGSNVILKNSGFSSQEQAASGAVRLDQ